MNTQRYTHTHICRYTVYVRVRVHTLDGYQGGSQWFSNKASLLLRVCVRFPDLYKNNQVEEDDKDDHNGFVDVSLILRVLFRCVCVLQVTKFSGKPIE